MVQPLFLTQCVLTVVRDKLLLLHEIICCDPSSEPQRRDSSDGGPQHMVSVRNKKKLSSNTPSYLKL